MAIIPYARVSSGKQLEGLSMTLQGDESLLEKIAREHNTTVSHLLYNDEGVSSYKGKNAKEGELAKLISDIESGLIKQGDIIVMRALDRLSRQNLTSSEVLYNTIISAGVQIYTTIDSFLYKKDDPMSSILATLALKTANEESAKKSHLTNRYASHRIQQFLKGDKPDNGTAYDIGIGRHPFWIQLKDKVVQPHEVNFDIAKAMFSKALQGHGTPTLLKYAESVGLKLSYSTVAKMFRSHSTYGDLHIRHIDDSGKPFDYVLKNYYPPIATENEYYQVRAIKQKLTKESNSQRKRVSILAGMQKLYCKCGWSMGASRDARNGTSYYRCLRGCFSPLKQNLVDTLVLNAVRQHVFDVEAKDTSTLDGLEQQLIQKKKQHKDAVKRFLLLGDDAGDTAQDIISELKADVDSLTSDYEQEKAKVASGQVDYSALAEFDEALRHYLSQDEQLQRYIEGDDELKAEIRHTIKRLVTKITIDEKHIVEIQLSDGQYEYMYLLRRRDGKKVHQRFYVPIKIHDADTIAQLRSVEPSMVNHVTIDEVRDLDLFVEDVPNPLPVIKVEPKDPEAEFFEILTEDIYEWKRKAIMNAGATSTQWQQFKDVDVSKYGFSVKQIEITTSNYTKQRKTVIYRVWDRDGVRAMFNAVKISAIPDE